MFNLTEIDKKIFNFLLDVKKYFNLNVEFRVSGGWIRDKLLGLPNDDIDIALSNMTGTDFVNYIKKYPNKNGIIGKDYQVALNAEKSKHLETAGIDIFGLKIEFVNLRSETYGDSRIPTVEMGTPETDAFRRDLTVNALFYNIEIGEIEDYVGGISDLKNKILRTPMDPLKTFNDDPLRMLRVLRFQSKFNDFIIDPKIIEAMRNPEIREAYKKKVSTERSGPEIIKMMSGKDPSKSLEILFDTDLYLSVFQINKEDIHEDGIKLDQKTKYHKYNLMTHTVEVIKNLNNIMLSNNEDPKMRGVMNIAALFHDFGKMKKGVQQPHPKNEGQMRYIGHEIESAKMADNILKSIGIGEEDRNIVNKVILYHMAPHSSSDWGNKGIGNFLNKTSIPGKEDKYPNLWKYIFYHAQADNMASQPDNYDDIKQQQMFNRVNDFINKPSGKFRGSVLDGNDLMQMFPNILPKTGFIRDFMDIVKNLQYDGKIDMTGVDEKNIPIQIKEQAKKELLKIVEQNDLLEKYTMEKKTMFQNWYKKIKLSQKEDIVFGPSKQNHKYQTGERVRDRRKGLAIPQEYGIIEKVDGDNITIKWYRKGKKDPIREKFNALEDSIALNLIVAEI